MSDATALPGATPTKVLVAIDFSAVSRLALDWALAYAAHTACELHVVHVIHTVAKDVLYAQDRSVDREMGQAEAEVERELAKWRPIGEQHPRLGTVISHTAFGHPASEILLVAERVGAGLIVVGSHGRTGIARVLVGSVAERVVRHAECPVVCVKPRRAD